MVCWFAGRRFPRPTSGPPPAGLESVYASAGRMDLAFSRRLPYRGASAEESLFSGDLRSLGSIASAQFAKDVAHVVFDGPLTDVQP